jgi:hypothetical protein
MIRAPRHAGRAGAAMVIALSVAQCGAPETAAPERAAPEKAARTVNAPVNRRVFEDHSRVRSRRQQMANKPATTMMVPQFVFNIASRWPIGSSVPVCFYGGDPALRRDILEAASEWTAVANLGFEAGPTDQARSCDPNQPSAIRIGFDDSGYWSVVGTTPTTERLTMSFQGFDTARPAPTEFRQVVLHEFGHAMGFEHEHQHPEGGCDAEFDWPIVYEAFAAPPNRWSKEKVDFNFRSLPASSAYPVSSVDRQSIMHYMLEPWLFKNGPQSPCFVATTVDLSPLDKLGAARFYPKNYGAKQADEEARSLDNIARGLPDVAVEAKAFITGVARSTRELAARFKNR